MTKEDMMKLIAQNLVAWDTSMDKRDGLLPIVYYTNKSAYERLVGVEYTMSDAIKRFEM